jgi:antitoxin component YwqK of YwqJK toxin-antitoxin module
MRNINYIVLVLSLLLTSCHIDVTINEKEEEEGFFSKLVTTIFKNKPENSSPDTLNESDLFSRIEKTYSNGKKHVVLHYQMREDTVYQVKKEYFYDSGEKLMEGPVTPDGKRNGNWKAYFQDGKIKSEGSFENDKASGKRTVYFDNGQKRYEGEYKNGKRSGTWHFWDKNGKLLKTKSY